MQDKECPRLTGMFASPISSCLNAQLTRYPSAFWWEEISSWKYLCDVNPEGSRFKNRTFDKSFCDISLLCHCYHVASPVNSFTGVLTKWKYKMGRNPFKAKQASGIAEFIWTFGGGNEAEPALSHKQYRNRCSLLLHNPPPRLLQLVKFSAVAYLTAMPEAYSFKHSNWEIFMQKLIAIFTQF